MSNNQPIIDVLPVNHSREQATNGSSARSEQRSYQQPSWNTTSGAGSIPPYGTWTTQGPTGAAVSKNGGSVIGGLAQIAAGTGLVMIGVPMLILPGPGLLAIAGGFALALNGIRKIFG